MYVLTSAKEIYVHRLQQQNILDKELFLDI